MAAYETRSTGIADETDVVVKTDLAIVPPGWQNLTPDQAAQKAWLVGRISRDGARYRVTSYAQQTFQRSDWKQNSGAWSNTYDEALAWIIGECNNVLERL
jgi:hypothetical protein